jgi:hypothetical protein
MDQRHEHNAPIIEQGSRPDADRLVPGAAQIAAGNLLNLVAGDQREPAEANNASEQDINEVRRRLLDEIQEFAAPGAPPSTLFELMHPELSDQTDPGTRLESYEAICQEKFDFRIGPDGKPRERQEIPHILTRTREEMGAELWDKTFEVAATEGMVNNSELRDGDTVKIGVLGGTPNAIANRTRYALEQISSHGAAVESFDFLVAEGQETDVALKEAELQLGVNVGDVVSRTEGASGTVLTLPAVAVGDRMVPVRIITARAKGDRTRATTLETMELWGELADNKSDARMVAVTTGLYTAFQKANAEEVITWNTGTVIDVIGHSAEWAGGKRFANQLLQEYKATVDSRYRLYQKMIQAGLVAAPSQNNAGQK